MFKPSGRNTIFSSQKPPQSQVLKFSPAPAPMPSKGRFATWYERFCAQPHQPLFVSGMLGLIAFTFLLLGVYTGTLSVGHSVIDFHAYAFVFIVFIQFFLGFLFVVFPKFLVQAQIPSRIYMRHFFAYAVSTVGVLMAFLFGFNAQIFMILNLVAQIFSFFLLFNIHKKSLLKDKHDTFWVLVGLASGLIFHALFLLAKFGVGSELFAIYGGFYLFLFVVVYAVSQRMIPFFTSIKVQGYAIKRTKKFMSILYVLLFLHVLGLSFFGAKILLLTSFLLFVLFAREFCIWKLPFFSSPAILWVLYVSLYWIPIGFFISFLDSLSEILNLGLMFEKSALHAFAIGYFLTILIGFGTRVTLGHSGQTPHASGFATTIFVFVGVVSFARLFAGVSLNFELDYIFFINLSAFLLALGLIIWSCKYLVILAKGFKPPH